MNHNTKNFINLDGWDSVELRSLLDLADTLKEDQKLGLPHRLLEGKNIGMVFDKSSLRTRVSFEVGINQLGAHAIVLGNSAGKLGEREPVSDFARVAARYVDGLIIRTYEEAKIEELIEYANVPVINALTDESHPCQAMGDMLTLREYWGELSADKTLAYIGDSNNVARSLMKACLALGVKMNIISPKGYQFSEVETAQGKADGFGFFEDPIEGVKGADAVYTDVWTSMGQEEEKEKRLKDFSGYQINTELMSHANDGAAILHCLPAHRNEEITEEMIEHKHSIIFEQAENRLHIQKAIMVTLFRYHRK